MSQSWLRTAEPPPPSSSSSFLFERLLPALFGKSTHQKKKKKSSPKKEDSASFHELLIKMDANKDMLRDCERRYPLMAPQTRTLCKKMYEERQRAYDSQLRLAVGSEILAGQKDAAESQNRALRDYAKRAKVLKRSLGQKFELPECRELQDFTDKIVRRRDEMNERRDEALEELEYCVIPPSSSSSSSSDDDDDADDDDVIIAEVDNAPPPPQTELQDSSSSSLETSSSQAIN